MYSINDFLTDIDAKVKDKSFTHAPFVKYAILDAAKDIIKGKQINADVWFDMRDEIKILVGNIAREDMPALTIRFDIIAVPGSGRYGMTYSIWPGSICLAECIALSTPLTAVIDQHDASRTKALTHIAELLQSIGIYSKQDFDKKKEIIQTLDCLFKEQRTEDLELVWQKLIA